MIKLTIEESVAEEFVYIGSAKSLTSRLGQRINDLDSPGDVDKKRYPSLAEKAAASCGWHLEVSWAETESHESAKSHEAALIQWHVARHCCLPSFGNHLPGEWVLGNKRVEVVKGPISTLHWDEWMPMVKSKKGTIPNKPGVYRIRAMPPKA